MKYGLIGKTLVHSYSKEIHEALGRYNYELFPMKPEKVSDFVGARDFGGLNVTIPYKMDVIALCDKVSHLASEIGAVNTLYFEDGKLCGHNTDYEGFLYAAKRAGIDFSGANVLILGSGGTSLMARLAVRNSGASNVFIASRKGGGINALSYDDLDKVAPDVHIIINTTPVGTYPDTLRRLVNLDDFPKCRGVIDVIYNPFKTGLLLDAEKKGIKYSNGLPMLVAQATAAAGYFLGTPGAFEDRNEKIISAMESKMRNIVLIGMPGCGKSTVGKILGQMTGKIVIDMDDEIVKRCGKQIPQIFEDDGELAFRDMETQVAKDLGKERGLIIATGGGSILRPENVEALRQNGLVIYLRRPVDKLATGGRPLSKNEEALRQMEKVRGPLYRAAADVTINNSRYLSKTKMRQMLTRKLPML